MLFLAFFAKLSEEIETNDLFGSECLKIQFKIDTPPDLPFS